MTSPKPTASAGVHGDWYWREESGTLAVSAAGELSFLSGQWDLSAFSLQLEGLSRARLHRTFNPKGFPKSEEDGVRCPLILSNGRRIELMGVYTAPGIASGRLVEPNPVNPSRDVAKLRPGPDLTPVFQPIISLKTGEAVGFEALARWDSREGATDRDFEDPALASNMLIRSAEALALWREKTDRADLFVHVNLTARDLAGDDLPGLLDALIRGYKLPAGGLKVELTEQAALRSLSQAKDISERLKAVGASVVLDDFGSGHSSFAWLAEIEAECLKTDADLTQRMHDPRARIILEAITDLARKLKMTTIAEGIEDLADLKIARDIGYDYAQGFALARPMFVDAAIDFLLIG